MARVQRGNVVLNVQDYEVQRYLTLGYNLTTPTGEILKASVPTDIGTLQKAYTELTAKCNEQEMTIARLTAELEQYKNRKPVTAKSTRKS